MKPIINLSEATLLALHSITLIARNEKINTHKIANELKASENHLAKVLQRLVKMDLIASTRGPGGGFKITERGRNANLLEIYEEMEGKISTDKCLIEGLECPYDECLFNDLNTKFGNEFKSVLKNKKIIDYV